MEKERGFKALAVVALLVAVVGVSVGFASFSRVLNISSTNVTVTSNSTDFTTNLVWNVPTGNGEVASGSNGATWTLPATSLDTTNTSKEYTATVQNGSSYAATLTSFTAPAMTNASCVAATDATVNADVLNAFCQALVVTVTYGSTSDTLEYSGDPKAYQAISQNVNTAIAAGSSETVKVKIDASAATFPDGDIVITIPQIDFNFTTAKAS